MAVSEQEQHIASIKSVIKEKSFHSYFRKHLGPINLDDDRILMLSIAMSEIELTQTEREAYITTAMLVQLALDTHEEVADPNASLKELQLKVLAGDYYSGLYYNHLANLNNIDLIRSFATAIKTVNENKISIYEAEGDTVDSFINSYKIVEFAVMEQLLLHFDAATYIDLFSEFLYLKKLISETEKLNTDNPSIFYKGMKKYSLTIEVTSSELKPSNEESEELRLIGKRYMEESDNRLEKYLRDLPLLPPLLRSRINEVRAIYQSSVGEG